MQADHPPIIGNSETRAIFHFSIDTADRRSTTAAISEKERVDLYGKIHGPLDFGLVPIFGTTGTAGTIGMGRFKRSNSLFVTDTKYLADV